MSYLQSYRLSLGRGDATRGYFTSFPLDWHEQVALNGPLPVVTFLHGGNAQATEIMEEQFAVSTWWTGVAGLARVKAIAFIPQGIAITSTGGTGTRGSLAR